MKRLDTKYLYKTEWISEYQHIISDIPNHGTDTQMMVIENGTILPTHKAEGKSWGLGGVVDNSGHYIEASGIGTAFGGDYPLTNENIDEYDETVYFVGCLPNHWGHFLIDFLCRFWFVLEHQLDFRIAFCGYGWKENGISENYLKMLKLLGIGKEKLILVKRKSRFSKILVPTPVMSYNDNYNGIDYKRIIKIITKNALNEAKQLNLRPYEKIYFTRTKFKGGKRTDVGEKNIEKAFKRCGFQVMAPERLSVIEQIFYIHSCKYMASLSGTISHNGMFLSNDGKLIILNRTCIPNHPQFRINYIFNIDYIYIDCYSKWIEKHPQVYGNSIIWVECSDRLKEYFMDNSWTWGVERFMYCTCAKNRIHFYFLLLYKKIRQVIKGVIDER